MSGLPPDRDPAIETLNLNLGIAIESTVDLPCACGLRLTLAWTPSRGDRGNGGGRDATSRDATSRDATSGDAIQDDAPIAVASIEVDSLEDVLLLHEAPACARYLETDLVEFLQQNRRDLGISDDQAGALLGRPGN